mmetsp:Transcript_9278/g.13154  ORF Transcript_9278/g.13154 Transcript_9278/m.13154 type:complete len:405 (-) Transcript_9278:120-1334(-)|eukprot:CAMPEP_0184864932 /NCGR_PEP_ID=MMETSP0580-20130426/16398_1 /TAXON_ID=1118495 /ORGANISM="Dactyliosolen fragilissimus" /LENGTH=404 /DNA_ID=CAMNT_0027363897 /DNA_START=143 /DNA_END=1357 /DNA_ORIENTATION=+
MIRFSMVMRWEYVLLSFCVSFTKQFHNIDAFVHTNAWVGLRGYEGLTNHYVTSDKIRSKSFGKLNKHDFSLNNDGKLQTEEINDKKELQFELTTDYMQPHEHGSNSQQKYAKHISSIRKISTTLQLEVLQSHLERLYNRSSSIRCPFWRRRAADSVDNLAMILRFLAIRHKSLVPSTILFEPPGCKAIGRHVRTNADGTIFKRKGLELSEILDILRSDWCGATLKSDVTETNSMNTRQLPSYVGYYITGKLDSTIYRDDCLFDGPDPDMPVRGLRKYLSAASHLFDSKRSTAMLLSIREVCQTSSLPSSTLKTNGNEKGKYNGGLIEARWKLDGVLMLPWRPSVKPWTGRTLYHLDDEGLIAFHEEFWDVSAMEAFLSTLWPAMARLIYGQDKGNEVETITSIT